MFRGKEKPGRETVYVVLSAIVLLIMVVLILALPAEAWAAAKWSKTVVAGQGIRPKLLKDSEVNKMNRAQVQRRTVAFAEVEIALSEDLILSEVSSLSVAPGSDLEVMDGGGRVKVQLPQSEVQALVARGADVKVLRKFLLVEDLTVGGEALDDIETLSSCLGPYVEGSNGTNVSIPDYTDPYGFLIWVYSTITLWSAPAIATVICIDVHFEIRHDWVGDLLVDLSTTVNPDTYYIRLWNLEGGSGTVASRTVTGITKFNGDPVNQTWVLWALDTWPDDWYTGYIDSWYIKVYYDDGLPHYCHALGGCGEYISGVIVGSISNTGTGCDGYADYTHLSTTMEIGKSYEMEVVNGDPFYDEDLCGIWIDWNKDLDFDDAGEMIPVNGSPGAGPYTATITPPAGAALGDTGMRIRIMWQDDGDLEPCDQTEYGEVEDYTVTVEQAAIAGDFDGDEDVDLYDVGILGEYWLTDDPVIDISPEGGDGIVNIFEFADLAGNWLEGVGP